MRDELKFKPIPKDIGDYIAYSEESSTGLVWRVTKGAAKKGKEAGRPDGDGYLQFTFRYRKYRNSRVIYFLGTGIDPEEKCIDHIDGDILNNKISNLRLATLGQNQDNRKKNKNNTSGITGVLWSKISKKWRVEIYKDHSLIYLGLFDNKDEAIAVRIAAEINPIFRDQEYRHDHNDKHMPSPEMLEWGKQYLEDRIERLNWKEKHNV